MVDRGDRASPEDGGGIGRDLGERRQEPTLLGAAAAVGAKECAKAPTTW
jgi:hypothetical protein